MVILLIITIILDGFLVYIVPNYFNYMTVFYPMLTITILSLIGVYIPKNNYMKLSLLIGIIYDLLYYNIFLYNFLIFFLLSKINLKLHKLFKDNIATKILVLVINIVIYDSICFILIYITRYNQVSFNDLIYKISNSLLLNILYLFVANYILKIVNYRHII